MSFEKNIKNANQPIWCPLYEDPPYRYHNLEKLSVICEVSKEIRRMLLPSPLEPLENDDRINIYISTAEEVIPIGVYDHCGIVVPCKYKDYDGSCVTYQGVSTEAALCSGREIWGFPKKLVHTEFKKDGMRITGYSEREGEKLLKISAELDPDMTIDSPKLYPRLLVRTLPRGDKPGIDSNKVFVIKSTLTNVKELCGDVKIELGGTIRDPFYKVKINKVIGAIYHKLDLILPYGEEIGNEL